MTARERQRHPYTADPDVPADHRGQPYCRCGLRRDSAVHDLPPVDPAVREAEAARLGEREEDE